jgi:PAS domain S-box-containing protein
MKKISDFPPRLRRGVSDRLVRWNVWHFVWISVLGSVLITAVMEWLFHGEVTPDFIVTAIVAALVLASLCIFFVDIIITRLKQAEADLSRANEKYSRIFHEAPVGICQVTPQGGYVTANMELARILGYDSPGGLMSRVTDVGRQVYAAPEDWRRLLSLLESGARVEHFEALNTRQDGSLVWTSQNCRAIRDASGRPLYVESSVSDISARKNLEAWRADMDRTMRHDLKSPLSGIVSMATAMAKNPATPAQSRQAVALIAATGEQVLRMINISLEINKIEAGVFDLRVEDVDLLGIVFDLINLSGDIIDVKTLTLEVEADGRPAGRSTVFSAYCHRLLFYCLVQNLLQNALESSPPGGVVRISLAREAGVTLEVRNQGAVPASVRERFFDKYATVGKKSGMGLGTYSVKLIAQAHGGAASMDTAEASGTLVTVRIPDLAPGPARSV